MVQAEQSVIGCLMMAPELLDRARAVLSPAMFEAQPLARIFFLHARAEKGRNSGGRGDGGFQAGGRL